MADRERGRQCAEEQAIATLFLELDMPEGYRAELIEGQIVVSPPPPGPHERVISRFLWQVCRGSQVDMDCSGHRGVAVAPGVRCTKNFLIPDLVIAPSELDPFASSESWMAPDDIALVAEVTWGSPETDRGVKRHCYGRAGIPLYLLVDRSEQTACLFSDPDPGAEDYREAIQVNFGKPIDLPEPFTFALDTSQFT